jgi:hypothetical protein
MTPRRPDDSKRKWWILVTLVLLVHLALLIFVRPGFFNFLLRDIEVPAGASAPRGGRFAPDAIIAIQVDVQESNDVVPLPEKVTSQPHDVPSPETNPSSESGKEGPMESIDLGELVGQAGTPRAGGTSKQETIPPRPVEITWPETRRLKHCIGEHVDMRILVGGDGRIQKVEPQPNDLPADCLRSALDAAGKIKFAPGKVDGKPATLWAQVRIDFEEKR